LLGWTTAYEACDYYELRQKVHLLLDDVLVYRDLTVLVPEEKSSITAGKAGRKFLTWDCLE
jgi:hypothetical protein